VCEWALYDRVENVLRPGVAQRRTVLVEQVHQLFGHLSATKIKTHYYDVFMSTIVYHYNIYNGNDNIFYRVH